MSYSAPPHLREMSPLSVRDCARKHEVLLRIHGAAVQQNFVVHVWPRGQARCAYQRNRIAALHHLSPLDQQLGRVRVTRGYIETMFDFDKQSVLAAAAHEADLASRSGYDRRTTPGTDVDSLVRTDVIEDGVVTPTRVRTGDVTICWLDGGRPSQPLPMVSQRIASLTPTGGEQICSPNERIH